MTPQEIETRIKSVKPTLKNEFGIDRIGYFGSFATGNYNDDSDIDILVYYNYGLGWKFFDLKDYLESLLNRKIDLVTEPSLKKQWKKNILREVKFL